MRLFDARTLLYNYVTDAKRMLDEHVPARDIANFLKRSIARLEKQPLKNDRFGIRWDNRPEEKEEEEEVEVE
jgi:hypothetical protein